MLLPDYVMFCTGFLGVGAHTMLIMAPGEKPELIVSEEADVAIAESVSWMANVSFARDPATRAAEHLRQHGFSHIALAGQDWMPYAFFATFSGALGSHVKVTSGDALLDRLARTKSPEELERVRHAAAIADAGFAALLAAVRPGVTDYELSAEVDHVVRCLGASDHFGLISASAHNKSGPPPRGHRLEKGDVIIAEITPGYGGYFAQLCRTIVLGGLQPHQKRDVALQREAMAAGMSAARPGQPVAAIARAINEVMEAAGYAQYSRPPYMRSRGHGMGFGSMMPGEITDDSPVILEPNTTLVIHPNQYFPVTGYLLLGDMVEATSDTVRSLLRTPLQVFTA